MAKSELGTKRIDPETGQKFYDLNKDPIVSPYTGKTYPLTFFETAKATRARAAAVADEEETVSINEVEEDEAGAKTDLPDVDGDEDDDVADEPDDTFLPDDEDEEDDMTDIIGGGRDEDDDV